MPSRLVRAKQDIVAEFETISVANGFNTDLVRVLDSVRHPGEIDAFPEVGVEFAVERMTPLDTACSVFESRAVVYVLASVKADGFAGLEAEALEDAAEAIRHDIKRVVATLMKKYAITRHHYWNIDPSVTNIEFGSLGAEGMPRGVATMACQFLVQIRNQDAQFSGTDYTFSSDEVLFDSTTVLFDRTT